VLVESDAGKTRTARQVSDAGVSRAFPTTVAMRKLMSSFKKILFVTGTDTGVGKTLFTALLLHYLREAGSCALAMKPFCSGGRGDVKLLQSLQPGELADEEMNPFYFKDPVAPLVAGEARRKSISLQNVVAAVQRVQARCDVLLIEGSGGLLVPLGRGFTVLDLIAKLDCQALVVARNRLGTINHTLLTVAALRAIGKTPLSVVLMSGSKLDISSRTNGKTIAGLLDPIHVTGVPFLGKNAARTSVVRRTSGKVKALGQVAQSGALR
jgi:dethiobiotin synthetase